MSVADNDAGAKDRDGANNVWVATAYDISGTPLSVYELTPSGATE